MAGPSDTSSPQQAVRRIQRRSTGSDRFSRSRMLGRRDHNGIGLPHTEYNQVYPDSDSDDERSDDEEDEEDEDAGLPRSSTTTLPPSATSPSASVGGTPENKEFFAIAEQRNPTESSFPTSTGAATFNVTQQNVTPRPVAHHGRNIAVAAGAINSTFSESGLVHQPGECTQVDTVPIIQAPPPTAIRRTILRTLAPLKMNPITPRTPWGKTPKAETAIPTPLTPQDVPTHGLAAPPQHRRFSTLTTATAPLPSRGPVSPVSPVPSLPVTKEKSYFSWLSSMPSEASETAVQKSRRTSQATTANRSSVSEPVQHRTVSGWVNFQTERQDRHWQRSSAFIPTPAMSVTGSEADPFRDPPISPVSDIHIVDKA
ncbi:MAG: hypothetical protein M1833_006741 [Piccolia ochrophora]|nr:MAG: hypothetical protein M1833_006741 [Piccolia ochrophora]